MLLGEGRTLRGHGNREAADVKPDSVDLPFADDRLAVLRGGDVARRPVEAEEYIGFLEYRSDRRIDVFAGILLFHQLTA